MAWRARSAIAGRCEYPGRVEISRLPVWLLLAVVVVVGISIAVGAILLANRAMPEVGKEHNSTLSPFISVVGLVYGSLLGFTVVVAWQQFSSAQAVVANEASTLTTMYRQNACMSVP